MINVANTMFQGQWGIRATTATTTATDAAATTELLDNAVAHIEGCKGRTITSVNLNNHINKLAAIRSLLQRIRYQVDLQTPAVASALAPIKPPLKMLVQTSSLSQITNIMDELDQASINLRRQLPGNFSMASDNKVTAGFQGNAPIGGQQPEGRIISEAMRNHAENSMQINAPVYGDISALVKLGKLWLPGGTSL